MSKSASQSRWSRRTVQLVAGLVVAGSAFTACGDDDKKSEPTHEEWFTAACEVLADFDPGFEAFFADHPQPTLDDWAAFLPTPIAEFEKFIVAANLPHPAEDDANLAAAVAAVKKVQSTDQAAIEAAEAGDQEAFDALDAQAQDVDTPAMLAALEAVEPRDCPGLGS